MQIRLVLTNKVVFTQVICFSTLNKPQDLDLEAVRKFLYGAEIADAEFLALLPVKPDGFDYVIDELNSEDLDLTEGYEFDHCIEFFELRGLPYHPYHIVDPSPWPFFVSVAALLVVIGAVSYFHSYKSGGKTLTLGLLALLLVLTCWWRDIVREATFQGHHTSKVVAGLRLGIVLFILSEIMFFFSFFWAFLHSSLAPAVEIGGMWPPLGFKILNPFGVPLLNTLILLTSGATVTYVHTRLLIVDLDGAAVWLGITLALAILFTLLQVGEYIGAPFNISDGVYASTFYLATGFHGLHVIIGTLFLSVACLRIVLSHFTARHHIGFEAAAWYWHFVDVVWLFLFLLVYIWGSL